MSTERPAAEAGGATSPTTGCAYYVYGIGSEEALVAVTVSGELPEGIEPGSDLKVVGAEGLAAVVSAVPLAAYDEAALAERLQNPEWTAERAMRHEGVVQHFAARATLVPLRFGTVYLTRQGVQEMLGDSARELRALLARLDGREEWEVSVYRDTATLLAALAERGSASSRDGGRRETPGHAYLLARKREARRAEEARAETHRVIGEVENALASRADGSTRLRLLAAREVLRGEQVARLAFLLPRSGLVEFQAEARRLAASHATVGFRLELVGPWPPYNFVAGRDDAGGE